MPTEPAPSVTVRRARLGVSLMFFTNGVLFSALLPRYPEIKADLGLSDLVFGAVVVAFPAGAILAAGAAAPLIRSLGPPRLVVVGSLAVAAAMAVAGWSPSVAVLMGALFVAGLVDAAVDAAQNVHGIAVERIGGRSIINSLHAIWSLGAATGGAIGAGAAALAVPVGVQMSVNGLVWSVVVVLAARLAVLPVPSDGNAHEQVDGSGGRPEPGVGGAPRRRAAYRLLVPLVLLAVCGTLMEDVANNWVVLYLSRDTTAPAVLAAMGLTIVLAAQFVGRLAGDPMTDRWGRGRVARNGGLLVALGMTVVVADLPYPMVMLGFALTGFGSATLVPAAFAAADRVPGLAVGTGVALVGWLMRLGFLLTSPVVGSISEAAGLRAAMAIPLAAGLVAAVLAVGIARDDRRRSPSPRVGATTSSG